jgi:hypothetical protein
MATQFANGKIVTDGLVLCLDAADQTSYPTTGTTWFDLAGSNNGTLTNGPTFNFGNGGSIVFDGVDDYAVSNNFTSIATSIWSCVMFLKAVTSSVAVEGYCFGWDSSNNDGMTIGQFQGNWISHCRPNSNAWITGPAVVSNTWTNITVTYDGTTQKIYGNGTLFNSKTVGFTSPSSQAAYIAKIGRLGSGFNFNGTVATTQFYNRALSATEVRQNYNAQKSRFGIY